MDDLNNLSSIADKYFHIFLGYIPKIIGAILIFIIGLFLIKIMMKYLRSFFDKRNYDEALKGFLVSMTDLALKIILTIIVVAQLGIQTSSLIALLGMASLAIGLAVKGALANFAGGVVIILLKPFRIGDWIEADGVSGSVKEVSLFYTRIVNFNNLLVSVPNGELSNNRVINYTVEGRRKDAMTIRVAYGTDVQKAREVLVNLLEEQEGTFSDPAPQVVVGELTHDCINLSVRFVASTADFWRIHWHTLEHAEERLNAAGIKMPYPKYDIRLLNSEKDSETDSDSDSKSKEEV